MSERTINYLEVPEEMWKQLPTLLVHDTGRGIFLGEGVGYGDDGQENSWITLDLKEPKCTVHIDVFPGDPAPEIRGVQIDGEPVSWDVVHRGDASIALFGFDGWRFFVSFRMVRKHAGAGQYQRHIGFASFTAQKEAG